MVAAATTSLPERSDQGRNYDYRYAWIRDQCYAGQAAARDQARPLLDDAVRFLGARPDVRPFALLRRRKVERVGGLREAGGARRPGYLTASLTFLTTFSAPWAMPPAASPGFGSP
jgi:hypothetical protein